MQSEPAPLVNSRHLPAIYHVPKSTGAASGIALSEASVGGDSHYKNSDTSVIIKPIRRIKVLEPPTAIKNLDIIKETYLDSTHY